MNRIQVFVAAAVVAAMAQTAGAGTLKGLARDLEKNILMQKDRTTVVLNFPYHDGRACEGSTIIQERLTTLLAGTGKIEVIERNLVEKLLGEVRMGKMGLLDPGSAKELGRILGAGIIVTGTLNDIAKATEINARAINAQTGEIVAASQVTVARTWKTGFTNPADPKPPRNPRPRAPRAQIALLLDTSNSMDGLIEQAKSQLWRIVNEIARGTRDGRHPEVQVALYEYGNNSLNPSTGYIRQVTPFTVDLDLISEKLSALSTNGGDEYCGWVIRNAVQNLDWDRDEMTYRAVFIAGNEPFTQGPVGYADACELARGKGIVINSIYCGERSEGMQGSWQAGAIAGAGEYINIDSNRNIMVVKSPYDDEISRLSAQINTTFVYFGEQGKQMADRQVRGDAQARALAPAGAEAERAVFKASMQYAKTAASNDLVSRSAANASFADSVDRASLPAELRSKTPAELKTYAAEQMKKRTAIQSSIEELGRKRTVWLAQAQKTGTCALTLDQAMLRAVQAQASRSGMKFAVQAAGK